MDTLELRELDIQDLKNIDGGSVVSDCLKGAAHAAMLPVTRVASLAAWQVAALLVAGGCAVGIIEG